MFFFKLPYNTHVYMLETLPLFVIHTIPSIRIINSYSLQCEIGYLGTRGGLLSIHISSKPVGSKVSHVIIMHHLQSYLSWFSCIVKPTYPDVYINNHNVHSLLQYLLGIFFIIKTMGVELDSLKSSNLWKNQGRWVYWSGRSTFTWHKRHSLFMLVPITLGSMYDIHLT